MNIKKFLTPRLSQKRQEIIRQQRKPGSQNSSLPRNLILCLTSLLTKLAVYQPKKNWPFFRETNRNNSFTPRLFYYHWPRQFSA